MFLCIIRGNIDKSMCLILLHRIIKIMNEFGKHEDLRELFSHHQSVKNEGNQLQHRYSESSKIMNQSRSLPTLSRSKSFLRNQKLNQIAVENERILKKLISINLRKSQSLFDKNKSSPKRTSKFSVPSYERENYIMANKLIFCKPSLKTNQR